jgi:hypothetical protein
MSTGEPSGLQSKAPKLDSFEQLIAKGKVIPIFVKV